MALEAGITAVPDHILAEIERRVTAFVESHPDVDACRLRQDMLAVLCIRGRIPDVEAANGGER